MRSPAPKARRGRCSHRTLDAKLLCSASVRRRDVGAGRNHRTAVLCRRRAALCRHRARLLWRCDLGSPSRTGFRARRVNDLANPAFAFRLSPDIIDASGVFDPRRTAGCTRQTSLREPLMRFFRSGQASSFLDATEELSGVSFSQFDETDMPWVRNRTQAWLFVIATIILTGLAVWGIRAWFKETSILAFAVGGADQIEARFAAKLATVVANNSATL